MPQQQVIIDLEPIGGKKVSSEELAETAEKVYNEIMKYKNDSSKVDSSGSGRQKPLIDTSNWGTYALYGGGTIAGIYLIGQALK